MTLSVGAGRLVQLNGVMADLFVANDAVADVQVRSNTSVYIFGKAAGQTTVYATDRSGRVIYSASVRVGQNLASVDEMLDLAMPEAEIRATPMSGMVLLTGTVSALGLLGVFGQLIAAVEQRLVPWLLWMHASAPGGATHTPPTPYRLSPRWLHVLSTALWSVAPWVLAIGVVTGSTSAVRLAATGILLAVTANAALLLRYGRTASGSPGGGVHWRNPPRA